MPFTPSHAIVALPFVRTPLVPAAIAIGSMTPDLPLFTRGLIVDYGITHDLRWLPLTTALALVLLLISRMLLRPACRMLAPRFLGARGEQARNGGRHARAGAAICRVLRIHVSYYLFAPSGRAKGRKA